ncbi:MAG: hypothetical protein ACX931_15970 [Saccharospirillum sp.]
MRGFIYVVDSSLYGVTDSDGRVTLPPVAVDDDARLMLWHPQMSEAMEVPLASLPLAGGPELTLPLPFEYEPPDQSPAGTSLRNRLQRFRNSGD